MNISSIIIGAIIGAIIGTLIGVINGILRFRKQERETVSHFSKSREVKDLISEVMDFTSKEAYAHSLAKIQDDALQKIKAICGHQGVQVQISYRHITGYIDVPYLDVPSIDIIKSLGFMKDYLKEIEGLWQIYEENDTVNYLLPFTRKFRSVYDRIMEVTINNWDGFDQNQKKGLIKMAFDEYDRNQNEINNKDQENLTSK